MLRGTFTALVTPLRNGSVDADAYRRLIDDQFSQGIDGVVPVGTTGESPTVSYQVQPEATPHPVVPSAKSPFVRISGPSDSGTAGVPAV